MKKVIKEAVIVKDTLASLRFHNKDGKLQTIWLNLSPSFTFKYVDAYKCFFDNGCYDILLYEFKHEALEKSDIPRVLTVSSDDVEFISDESGVLK